MTDIVERLRNPLIVLRAMALRIEAADTIERLRRELDWYAKERDRLLLVLDPKP